MIILYRDTCKGAMIRNELIGPQSMITEKMVAVHFPSNALRSKTFTKANGCLLKDRRMARSKYVYSAKISHHYVILFHLYSVIFN